MTRARPGWADYLAVGLAAGTGLAYEILLLRVFSYSQWHHFASLAVSLALLGFGAAGTVLTLLGPRAVRWGDRLFVAGLLIAAFGMILAFLLPHAVTVRPLFAIWDWGELGKVALIDLASFLPFFGLALSLGQVFMRWPEHTPRLYAANLIGSGLGSFSAWPLLSVLFLETALITLVLLIFVVAGLLGAARRSSRFAGMLGLSGALAVTIWMSVGLPALPLSDFKRLAYLLDLPDAEVIVATPDPRSKVTVVRSDSIRVAPGLSLRWTEPIPSMDALVLGADRAIPLPRDKADLKQWEHRQAMLGRLPFLLRPEGRVGVLGTSAWLSPFQASNREVIWAEPHPAVIETIQQRGLLEGVEAYSAGVRPFLESREQSFSLLVLETAAEEGDAATEDYSLTVEALARCIERLEPGGVLAIPLRLNQPPLHAPKLIAMAGEALRMTEGDPGEQAAMLRSMQEGLLLLSNETWSETDLRTMREFAGNQGFDLVAMPGLEREEANRFHQLGEPVFYETAKALWRGEGEVPSAVAWRMIAPSTDAQPYFWRTMRWEHLPALMDQLGRPGLIWLDWALLALAAKLVLVAAAGVILILLPLGKLPRTQGRVTRWRVALYFIFLGLGFLLFEMAIFQRAVLYLDHPVLAASIVFGLFLIGSGLGSLTTPGSATGRTVGWIFLPVALFASIAMLAYWSGGSLFWEWPEMVRALGVGLAAFPLAWAMGRPMPWGLRQLDKQREMIPWAWGVNGFASVMAGPLAALMAVHFNQSSVWLLAALCYGGATWLAWVWTRTS